jgi:hypothetical protein
MNASALDTLRRITFALLFMGLTGWAVWRVNTYDPYESGDVVVSTLMFSLFGLTSAFAAVGMVIPDEPDAAPVAVEVVPDPIDGADRSQADADGFYPSMRGRRASVLPRRSVYAADWQAGVARTGPARDSGSRAA